MARILKATQTRDALGVVVDTRHEGSSNKRPTEKSRLDGWTPVEQKSPGLFQRIRALRAKKPQLSWEDAEREVIYKSHGSGSEEKE